MWSRSHCLSDKSRAPSSLQITSAPMLRVCQLELLIIGQQGIAGVLQILTSSTLAGMEDSFIMHIEWHFHSRIRSSSFGWQWGITVIQQCSAGQFPSRPYQGLHWSTLFLISVLPSHAWRQSQMWMILCAGILLTNLMQASGKLTHHAGLLWLQGLCYLLMLRMLMLKLCSLAM